MYEEKVASIAKTKAKHQQHSSKLDELFASLQHRALQGEL
jgi:hypothetical protein